LKFKLPVFEAVHCLAASLEIRVRRKLPHIILLTLSQSQFRFSVDRSWEFSLRVSGLVSNRISEIVSSESQAAVVVADFLHPCITSDSSVVSDDATYFCSRLCIILTRWRFIKCAGVFTCFPCLPLINTRDLQTL